MKKESVLPKGSLIQATRIIIYLLEINSYCTCTDIKRGCGIRSTESINNALLWLVNNKILNKTKTKSSSSIVYYINPDWKKIKYNLY